MKIDTTTILLVAGAGLAVYLVTRPTVPTYNPYLSNPVSPYGTPVLQSGSSYYGNETAQDIAAGGSALKALGDVIGNFF